ncbi:MAG: hypothetical protein JO299_19805 [Gammaproteobacteria bacterium]|nr:hypothetical protein [Gammaproteobacteria bacterium]
MLLLITAPTAVACPLCYDAVRESLGQRLDTADRAVLATPISGSGKFQVVEVVKRGKGAVGDVIGGPITNRDTSAALSHDPLLLLGNYPASGWSNLGNIRVEHADWLRQLIATRMVKDDRPPPPTWSQSVQGSTALSYEGWRQRIEVVVPYLENSDRLVAEIAWGELARSPYAALDVVRSRLNAATVTRWLDDPQLAPRHAAYMLLLGFVGGPADAARLEQHIDDLRISHRVTNLGAMIAADLELRGPIRAGWVEALYLADHTRNADEIEAAVLALGVLGDANRTIPRERVTQAYRTFIREHPAMAGSVAPQLAGWKYWDAAAEYAAVLRSDAILDPASEFAIVSYLRSAAAAGALP